MCGIAGFHCSQEVADTIFDDGTACKLIVAGLNANAHRGRDASGFFAVYDKDTVVEKTNLNSDVFIKEVIGTLELGKPRIAGVHTRAATKGDPKHNENNHPVVWGNVIVTHNGIISNDEEIKKSVKYEEKPEPEVDSSAIAAILNDQAPQPYDDFENILKALAVLRGGFAFHAVWINHPGYSLLVRGNANPLHFQFDEMGLVLYSSEAAGVRELAAAFGLEKGTTFSLDTRKAVLLYDGKPVRWGAIPDSVFGSTRIRRKTKKGVVWVDTAKADYYAGGNRPWNIALDDCPRNLIKDGEPCKDAIADDWKTFAGQQGYVAKLTIPTWSDEPFAALAEADNVDRFSFSSCQDDTISAWFGDVELLIDADGKLLDVFNWADVYERFTFEALETKADSKPWDEWFKLHTTTVLHTTTSYPATGGPSRTNQEHLPFRSADGTTNDRLNHIPAPKWRKERSDGLPSALFENIGFLGLQEIEKLPRCKREVTMPVLFNERCPKHHQWLQNHQNPEDCEFAQMAVLAAMDKAPTITNLMAMVRGKMTVQTRPSEQVCLAHVWQPKKKIRIPIVDGLVSVDLPHADACAKCDAMRFITLYQPAVQNFMKARNLRVTL